MSQKRKMFPIHSNDEVKGRIVPISDKIKRNSSCFTSQNTRAMIDATRKTANSTQRKLKSAVVTVRNCNTTATNFITSWNVGQQNTNIYNQDMCRLNPPQKRRKSSYLSRRFIHKKLLQSYIDNVFQKVSLIRATQERPISSIPRNRGRKASNTTR